MKIIVEIHHGIGDIVKMIPVFKNLKDMYPDAWITAIVVSEEHAEILELLDVISDYCYLDIRKMSLLQRVKFVYTLRKMHYDMGIVAPMTTQKMGNFLMKAIGCKEIIMPIKPMHHYTDNDCVLSILRQIGLDIYNDLPKIILPDKLRSSGQHLILADKKNIAVCVGTGMTSFGRGKNRKLLNVKGIDIHNTMETVKKLSEDGHNIILLGGKAEERLFDGYSSELPPNTISCIGKLSIIESMAILSNCDLVVGGDTGLMHLADALGIETLVYYGASFPEGGPPSNKSHLLTANLNCQYCLGTETMILCKERKCLDYITSELLYNTIKEILS